MTSPRTARLLSHSLAGTAAIALMTCSSAFAQTPSTSDKVDLDKLLEMDLETVLEQQTSGRGDVGSFGYRLGTSDSKVDIHGYVTNEYIDAENANSTFDNHYFNLLVGTQVGEKIFAEIQLEYEHGGEEIQARYAQVDYKINNALIIRTGKFLIPINTFNEYLYPEYINKAISRPFINRNIAPTAWAEVGLQLRGSFQLGEHWTPFYSAYVVNGLEGDPGGDIRGMRNNHRDRNNDNKAFGGRIGVTSDFGFEAGAGTYYGVYTPDGDDDLLIGSFDAAYTNENFTLRAEYSLANMSVSDTSVTQQTSIERNGASLTASYIFNQRFEPIVRYDFMAWDDPADETKDKSRIYLGMNYRISNTMNAKVGYELITNEGTDVDDNVLSFQLALGF